MSRAPASLKPDERAALEFIDRGVAASLTRVLASDIARSVGWPPRTAGSKMRSLERRGFVRRIVVRPGTFNSDTLYGWVLADE